MDGCILWWLVTRVYTCNREGERVSYSTIGKIMSFIMTFVCVEFDLWWWHSLYSKLGKLLSLWSLPNIPNHQIKTSKSFSPYSIPTKKYGVSHGTNFTDLLSWKIWVTKVASCLLVNALADSECGLEPKSTGTKFRCTQFPLKQLYT